MDVNNNKELSQLVPEIIALLGGIVSAVVLVMPLSVLLGFLGILVAPIVEEVCKICGVFYLALYYPNAIPNKTKGIVLGGLAGLGFAFTENFLYIIRGEMGLYGYGLAHSLPLLRIFPLISHVLGSALVGIGLVSFAQRSFVRVPLKFSSLLDRLKDSLFYPLLLIAIILHLFYNFVLTYFGIGLWYSLILTLGIEVLIFIKIKNYLPNRLEHIGYINPFTLIARSFQGGINYTTESEDYDMVCKDRVIPWLGGTYIGNLKNSKPNGRGKLSIPNDIIYDGEWFDGKPNGKGKIIYPDKSIYQGEWKNGKKHGKGKYIFPEGNSYIGTWSNGEYMG